MDDLNSIINKLKGITKPTIIKCIIAVTKNNGSFIISSDEDTDNIFDGEKLEDILTDTSNIPQEAGIFGCKISYQYYSDHHPLDPVEYDIKSSIISYNKITLKWEYLNF